MRFRQLCYAGAVALSACSVQDSRVARQAQSSLLGFSERDLETCLGVPNRKDRLDQTTILSYDGTSTNSGGFSVTLPVVGGLSFSGGGYCHVTVRLDNDRVTSVRYSGETSSTAAPDAYCAPVVRGCFSRSPQRPPAAPAAKSDPVTPEKSASSP
jgi:hypothetical protein